MNSIRRMTSVALSTAALAGVMGAIGSTGAPAAAAGPAGSSTVSKASIRSHAVSRLNRSASDAKKYPRLYPLLQYGTGPAQWNNCVPVTTIATIYAMGKTPSGWNGMSDRKATETMRYSTMGLTHASDNRGMGFSYAQKGLSHYGLKSSVVSGSATGKTVMSRVRSGHVAILTGNALKLPNTYRHDIAAGTTRPISHVIVIAGYDKASKYYLVLDPASLHSDPKSVVIHRFSAKWVQRYADSAGDNGRTQSALITTGTKPAK